MKDMLCEISHALTDKAHEQLDNLDCVNAKEMDYVVHMIKNLSEAMYYCTIVEAMEKGENVSKIAVDTASHGTIVTM